MRREPRGHATPGLAATAAFFALVATLGAGARRCGAAPPRPDEIFRAAERQRGLARPHTFLASIAAEPDTLAAAKDRTPSVTRVEVRSNGFAQQLVLVLEPSRGDVLLSTPDVVWLRPRRLHRLTRLPPELRMFGGASVGDVTSIDLVGLYDAALDGDDSSGPYRLALSARGDTRYPRASYVIARGDLRPVQIDFMAASGKVLKTVAYAEFASILDRVIPTQLVVRDHVHHDASVVRLSDFHVLSPVDPAMFTPDYLLTIEDES